MKTNTEIKDLNTKLSLVSLASDGYVSIRNRFLAVPRRGVAAISIENLQLIARKSSLRTNFHTLLTS